MATNPHALATPKEVAAQLAIAPSTLRTWSKHFASQLSTTANPPKEASGRVGRRLYNPQDVAILARAKTLLDSGLPFSRVLAILQTEPESLPAVVNPGHLAESGDVARALVAITDLAISQRQRLDELESRIADLEQDRRPFWQRLWPRS